MTIQWFPGHMAKARREVSEKMKYVDIVFELVDARLPLSSRNPMLDQIIQQKPRLVLLNKADLADPQQTKLWQQYFRKQGHQALAITAQESKGIKALIPAAKEALKEKRERDAARGIKPRAIRAMVLGIPNVGKSTLMNRLVGKKIAQTGNKPGVTKGQQWLRLGSELELLDTPGILWPKFEDQQVGIRLACVGSIKDDILNMEELALWLIDYLRENYKDILAERYQITEEGSAVEVLEQIARARGCLKKQEELDYAKASLILFDDFRSGKMGCITLERAPL